MDILALIVGFFTGFYCLCSEKKTVKIFSWGVAFFVLIGSLDNVHIVFISDLYEKIYQNDISGLFIEMYSGVFVFFSFIGLIFTRLDKKETIAGRTLFVIIRSFLIR